MLDARGKLLKTPKDRLREEPRLQPSYGTISRIVEEARGEGTDIVAKFKRWAAEWYRETA